MRTGIPQGIVRIAAVLLVVAGAALLLSTEKPAFTVHDKAYYLDPKTASFVRPGLVTTVTGAQVASDGTITAQVTIADPKGQPLDKDGVTTPGVVSISLIAAYIPADQEQYVAYTTRTQTSTITGASAVQAGTDSGGTWTKTADGKYTYTFKTKVPQGDDPTTTHTIGVYSTRDLSEFDAGVAYSDSTFNWVPAGGAVTKVRDVIQTASCNKCHTFDKVGLHGGSRQTMELCVLCHTPQTHGPGHGQHGGPEGDGAQDPRRRKPAERAGGHAVPDHRQFRARCTTTRRWHSRPSTRTRLRMWTARPATWWATTRRRRRTRT